VFPERVKATLGKIDSVGCSAPAGGGQVAKEFAPERKASSQLSGDA
jgi:hypothetical protein